MFGSLAGLRAPFLCHRSLQSRCRRRFLVSCTWSRVEGSEENFWFTLLHYMIVIDIEIYYHAYFHISLREYLTTVNIGIFLMSLEFNKIY